MTPEEQVYVRQKCIEQALSFHQNQDIAADVIVATAQEFWDFIKGGSMSWWRSSGSKSHSCP